MARKAGRAKTAEADVDPRIERSMLRVRQAALEELAEAGYGAFTIDAVSRRCGVARSTIYRHWPDKLALIRDALEILNRQPRPEDHEASPRDHVEALLTHLAEVLQGPPIGDLLPALVAGAQQSDEVAKFFHAYSSRRRRGLEAAIRRGVEAGRFREDLDPHLAAIALSGALFYRRLMTGRPFPARKVPHLVDAVVGPDPRR